MASLKQTAGLPTNPIVAGLVGATELDLENRFQRELARTLVGGRRTFWCALP